MIEEIIVPMKGFEGKYEISNLGRVYSLLMSKGRTEMFGNKRKNGGTVHYFHIQGNDRGINFSTKKLVALHFLECPAGCIKWKVRCIDGDEGNTAASNLEWVKPLHMPTKRLPQYYDWMGINDFPITVGVAVVTVVMPKEKPFTDVVYQTSRGTMDRYDEPYIWKMYITQWMPLPKPYGE